MACNVQREACIKGDLASKQISRLPYTPTVTGVVNVSARAEKMLELSSEPNVNHGLVIIMGKVLSQLILGASSGVLHPGTTKTVSKNAIPDPGENICRVVDALVSIYFISSYTGLIL